MTRPETFKLKDFFKQTIQKVSATFSGVTFNFEKVNQKSNTEVFSARITTNVPPGITFCTICQINLFNQQYFLPIVEEMEFDEKSRFSYYLFVFFD